MLSNKQQYLLVIKSWRLPPVNTVFSRQHFSPKGKTQHTQLTGSCIELVMPLQNKGVEVVEGEINQHSWKQQHVANRSKDKQWQQKMLSIEN